MAKTPITLSHPLRQAVTAMSTAFSVEVVGLVLRFDKDDATIRTMFSEPSGTGAHAANPPLVNRGQLHRHLNDGRPGEGTRLVTRERDAAGYHAEEFFIACGQLSCAMQD